MAAVGKKKKTNWKPVSAQLIIDAKRKNNFNINCTNNWEDEVAKEMDGGNSSSILDAARLMPKVDLPTAPRASRGSIVDDSKIPHSAPFQAYLSNIPYDLIEDDLINFFQDLRVKSVRLPKEEKSSKAKGFGYIEFEDRASLSSALNLADTTIKGRAMKIELPNNSDMGGRGGNRRNNRDGGRDQTSSDRTTGNWRAGPRQDDVDDRYDRGGGGGGGSGYGGRRDYGGGSAGGSGSSSSGFNRGGFDDRNYHREERFDRGGRDDRGRDERGGGSFRDRYDRDRGFGGRGDRGGDREGFSYNDRGFRDRGTRDDDRYSRNDDRSGSSSSHWRDDQQRGGENRGFGGGRFDDRRDRRGDDRDRDGGGKFGPPRRDEGPPIDRGNEARNRPRLQLQPRTKPKENTSEAPSTAASIFGGAKPVDTAAREREIEERLMRSEDFNESKSKANSSSGGSTRGEGGSTRGEGGSTRGEAGSTRGDRGERQWEPAEKKVEPAPPPKENAWSRKAAQSVVNNGRSTPDDDMSRSNIDSDEINQEDTRSRRSGDDRGQGNSRGPVTTTADKPRGKELERNVSKHRERKESIDDISKMPKVPETKAPNFAVSNKYSSLVDSDEAPNE